MIRQPNEHVNPESSRALKQFRRYVPMTDTFYGQRFLVRKAGLLVATLLPADLIHRLIYLKVGLALVLVWVGIKMLLEVDIVYIPTAISLTVIAVLIGGSVAASLYATRDSGRRAIEGHRGAPVHLRHRRGDRGA